MTEVVLPEEAWQDVEPGAEALLDAWLVKEGDRVEAGQLLAKAVLVKATIEVTAPIAGVVERILVRAEETFKRGQALVRLRGSG
jgi:pyruvate/2-oxoglutarate dehydrogenase complex dihydrolipoamide acyltransferase (E2) component